MKRSICIILSALVALALVACGSKSYEWEIADGEMSGTVVTSETNYEESTERILNPDIGFYRTLGIKLTEDGGTSSGIYDDYQLHHLRVNIGAFSKAVNGVEDLLITEAALSKLDSVLSELNSREKSAIVRFAYDGFNGVADTEPSESMMLEHVRQLCVVLNRYENTITAIETGMVGKWGEMHSSKLANPKTINKLVDLFLNNTDFPVLVRTPKMMYDYLGISLKDINTYTISPTKLAYRLGLFNDGYLGSKSDLGTYSDREAEVEWLSKQTAHLPYGGEVVVGDADGDKMSEIKNCLGEMNKLCLSYLNYEWNNIITQDKWVKSKYKKSMGDHSAYYGKTAQQYIENHLGYRFVIRAVKASKRGDKLAIKFKTENVGFGNLNNKMRTSLFIVKDNEIVSQIIATDFTGEQDYSAVIPLNGATGELDVYMRLCKSAEPYAYPMYFANVGMKSDEYKANLIAKVNL